MTFTSTQSTNYATKALLILGLSTFLLSSASNEAVAQEADSGQVALGFVLMGLSTGSGVLSGYMTWGKGKNSDVAGNLDVDYMRAHAVALRQDISLGRGLTVVELARAVEVHGADVHTFGALLRQNRAQLLPLIDPDVVTETKVLHFLSRVRGLGIEARKLAKSARGGVGSTS